MRRVVENVGSTFFEVVISTVIKLLFSDVEVLKVVEEVNSTIVEVAEASVEVVKALGHP